MVAIGFWHGSGLQGQLVVAQPVAAPGAMRGQIQLTDDFAAPLDALFEALR
jgi:hypothetical protein